MLIVDDSKLTRAILSRFIQEHQPSWCILEAEDSGQALEVANGKQIEWITVDYNMPGMNGISLAKLLIKSHPEAKITLLTGSIDSSTYDKAKALKLNVIEKPVTEQKIKALIT
jgi:DNA-binding NarL/FixJ family response regulator